MLGHDALPAKTLPELIACVKAHPGKLNFASHTSSTISHVMGLQLNMATSIPLIKGGNIKAFAVSTPKRSPLLPDVPTFTELGYPQLEAIAWMGLWVKPDLSVALQAQIREAALKALAQPGARERLQEVGFEPGQPRTPEELSASLKADYERVGAVLKSIGFKPE
jgi:tripartite-type tricarboxylate transporter receptor subunit TctC